MSGDSCRFLELYATSLGARQVPQLIYWKKTKKTKQQQEQQKKQKQPPHLHNVCMLHALLKTGNPYAHGYTVEHAESHSHSEFRSG